MIAFLLSLFLRKIFETRSWILKLFFELFSVFLTLSIIYYAGQSFELKTEETSTASLFIFLLAGEVALIIPMGIAERLLGHYADIRNSHFLLTLTGLKISPLKYVLSKTAADSLFLILRVASILIVSKIFLSFPLNGQMFASFFLSQVFAVVCFVFMGLIAIQFYRKFQKGMGVFYSLQTVAAILGGIYFPVSVFPVYLKNLAVLIPQTLVLKISRQIFSGKTLYTEEFLKLGMWSFVFYLIWHLIEKVLDYVRKINGQVF